ncbi:MAG: hypothetical protein ACE5IY_10245 [bacterium]
MARIPESPEEIFGTFSNDVQKVFGADLVAIILFGSGARGQYVRDRSDINFLIVLTQTGIDRLHEALDLVARWRKVKVAVPLFLTREYIDSALDTFPIEFLDMKNFHKLVFGEDVLAGIQIDKNDLRRQIERELRGKLIHLRSGFLSTGNDRTELQNMLAASVTAFIAIFEGLLYLKEQAIPDSKPKSFQETAQLFGLDSLVFTQVMNIKRGEWRGSKIQVQGIAVSYIHEIKKLVEVVDKM